MIEKNVQSILSIDLNIGTWYSWSIINEKNTFYNAQFKTKKELLILSPRKILIVNAWNIFFLHQYMSLQQQ